jgi:hypothetical protein
MSAITFGRASNDALVFGGHPRVHLLPREIDEQRKQRTVRRLLLLALAIVLLAVVGGMAFVSAGLLAANNTQAAEQPRAAQISREIAKYGAVTSVQSQVQAIKAIQPLATSGEVLWTPFLTAVKAVLPADTTIISFKTALATAAVAGAPPAAIPLSVDHVATVTVTGEGPQASVQAWLAQLPSVKGVVLSSPSAVTLNQQTGLYDGTAQLQLGKSIVASRFGKVVK